jgi:VWFA-related protein
MTRGGRGAPRPLGPAGRAALALACALGALTFPDAADPAEPPRLSDLYETTTSSLVLIEFWARDPEGHPVAGLGPEEFELFIDGARRPYVTAEPATQATAAGADVPGPGTARGTAADRARRFVLFFNDGMSRPERMARARRGALDFVAKGGAPGDLFAVTASEENRHFRLIQGFTADRERVTAALQGNLDDGTRSSSIVLELSRPLADGADGTMSGIVVDASRAREHEVWLQVMGEQVRISGRATVEALEAVIAWLAPFHGPKAIVYCGDGFAGADQRELDRVSRAASAASVTIHTLNTMGLTIHSAADDTLAALSITTGGLRVNSNDASVLFKRVDAEAAGAYVLSFIPPMRADGRPHSLRIACTRPGVEVRNRTIFIRETPEQTREREVEAAFIAPELHDDFALDAMAPEHGGQARDLLLYVPAGRLLFLPIETTATAQVEVGLVARDEKDKVVARLSRRLDIRLSREAGLARPAVNLRLPHAIPPEARRVTAVLVDLQSGALGASRTETALESHAASLAGLAIGLPGERSLWISADTAARSGRSQDPESQALGSARRMRYRTTESPVCEVHLTAARPDGGRGLRLVLADGTSPTLVLPLDGAEIAGASGAGTVLRTRIPLIDVPPGEFVLKLEQIRGEGAAVELGRLPLRVVPAEPT